MQLIDQLDRRLEVKTPINSMISLVPSHTELLLDLGLKDLLKGRTKFCIHPKDQIIHIPIVGGTKTIHLAKIDDIKPDLIICNKEENNKEDVNKLAESYPVWVSDIKSFDDSSYMIQQMAALFDVQSTADTIIDRSRKSMKLLKSTDSIKAAYLIWRKPYMTVGSDTYIHHMMSQLGFQNVFSDRTRYPEVTIEELVHANPETILLSSEPYPFSENHKIELQKRFPKTNIQLVDGEVFSWYGSRILNKHRI